jgi:C-terminal processing protease CtpA/Prc
LKQKQRLAWAFLTSAIIHSALFFSITLKVGLLFSQKEESDANNQGRNSKIIKVEILPKPIYTEQQLTEQETTMEIERVTVKTDKSKRTNSRDCPNFYGGIGVLHNEFGIILKVVDGYPASRAGILPGDILLGDTEYIIGEIGTAVDVTVLRGEKTLKFSMIREKICTTEKE